MSAHKDSTGPGRPRVVIEDKLLKKLYLEDKLSTRAIAVMFDVSHQTIHRRLTELGVPTKTWLIPNQKEVVEK